MPTIDPVIDWSELPDGAVVADVRWYLPIELGAGRTPPVGQMSKDR